MNKKGFLLVLLALLISLSISVKETFAKPLSDIPNHSIKEIEFLINKNIINGLPNGSFGPNKLVSRAEAAVMIGRALQLDGTLKPTSFKDVSARHYGSGYIESVHQKEIIIGVPGGKYDPDASIRRGDMAMIIARAYGIKETSNIHYSDVKKTDYYYQAINALSTAGIVQGVTGGAFKPTEPIDRTEISLMIARAMETKFRVKNNVAIGTKYVSAPEGLNIRSGPSTGYKSLGVLPKNTQVTIYSQTGSWVYVTAGKLTGYVHNGYLSNTKVYPRVIAIDPGHGGSEPGSSGIGIVEKDLNLDVSLRVQKKLEKAGIKVVMTRTTDKTVALNDRVPIAVKGGADTFVSIHSNAHPNTSANGTESFYSRAMLDSRAEDSKQLAIFIQKRLLVALNTTNRGVKEMGFRVIKTNPLPAALIELGFITNINDATKLKQDKYKEKSAEAIYLGIIDYYNWKEK